MATFLPGYPTYVWILACRVMRSLPVIVCCAGCFFINPASAQITITTSQVHAFCPNTGRITVNVNGGTPNYTFTITSPSGCLPAAVPPVVQASASYTFLNLQGGCSYRVTATDITGNTASRNVSLLDLYPAMNTPTLTSNMFSSMACSYLEATSSGGSAPFVYTFYAGASATNPAAQIQTGASNILPLAAYPQGTYTVKIRDNCGTERVRSVTTDALQPSSVNIARLWRPDCNEFRLNLNLSRFAGAVTINILDRNGNPVTGITSATGFGYTYPYTIANTNLSANHPWGLSNVTPGLSANNYDLPVPNNPALYPLSIKVKDNSSCNFPQISTPVTYPFTPGASAYLSLIVATEACDGTICMTMEMRNAAGQLLENFNYNVSIANAFAGPYTAAGTTINMNKSFCGLQPSTNYFVKSFDPCTGRDSIIPITTPALKPFTVSGGIISYCVNPASSGYFATAFYSFMDAPGANSVTIISGPGGPRTINSTLLNSLLPGNYVLQFTDACGIRTVIENLTVGGTYNTTYTTGTHYSQSCSDNCIVVDARGLASGTLVPNGLIPNFYSAIRLLPINTLIKDSLHTGQFSTCNLAPGTYTVSTAPFYPGITCVIPVIDTVVIPAYSLPVVNKVYNVRCAPVNNIIAPMPPNVDTSFVYSLYNSTGTLIAGPQSVHGNPAASPVINAVSPPEYFQRNRRITGRPVFCAGVRQMWQQCRYTGNTSK